MCNPLVKNFFITLKHIGRSSKSHHVTHQKIARILICVATNIIFLIPSIDFAPDQKKTQCTLHSVNCMKRAVRE